MELSEDGMRGDREETLDTPGMSGTPDPRPGEEGTSRVARRYSGTNQYDPDPRERALGIDQLVVALHEAFTKGGP